MKYIRRNSQKSPHESILINESFIMMLQMGIICMLFDCELKKVNFQQTMGGKCVLSRAGVYLEDKSVRGGKEYISF